MPTGNAVTSRFSLSLCLLALAATLQLGAGREALAAPSGTLRYGVFIDLRNWNPQTQPNLVYVGPVYEGLLQIKSDGVTPEPGLAESWELTPTDLTFKLRRGVTFHDGVPFNADAVIANIGNVQKSNTGAADVIASVKKVTKIDDYTIRFELAYQDPALPFSFTLPELYMISPQALADGSWITAPVGTGPYVFQAGSSVASSKYVFSFYDKYYAPDTIGPAIIEINPILDDAARLNALLSGQLDAALGDFSQREMMEAEGFKAHSWMALRYHFTFLDRSNLFSDPLLRKAMCMAMPLEQIRQVLQEGWGAAPNQRFDAGDPAHVADLEDIRYDIEGAKALMAKAGNPKVKFAFPYLQAQTEIAQLTQENFAKIGVDMELQMLSPGEYFGTLLSGKYPIFYNNAISDEKGGMFRFYPFFFAKEGKGNVFKVHPPAELDRLYKEAQVAPVQGQPALLQKMTRLITDQALDCGHLAVAALVFYNPDRVKTAASTTWAPSALRYKDLRMTD